MTKNPFLKWMRHIAHLLIADKYENLKYELYKTYPDLIADDLHQGFHIDGYVIYYDPDMIDINVDPMSYYELIVRNKSAKEIACMIKEKIDEHIS